MKHNNGKMKTEEQGGEDAAYSHLEVIVCLAPTKRAS